jgi:ParB-like chromosome segregation protein Spo0J
MQIIDVPIDQIEIPEVRVTSYMSEEIAQQFALSVQAAGVMQPLHCLADNGRIILVDGLHRLQEARARGDTTIACVVIPGDLRLALLQNLVTSGLRGRPKASEMRRVVGALEDEYQMDSIAIRKATGLSQDYMAAGLAAHQWWIRDLVDLAN